MLFWGVRCVIHLLKIGIRRSNPYCVVCDGELFWIFLQDYFVSSFDTRIYNYNLTLEKHTNEIKNKGGHKKLDYSTK
jgi:hypothetical protein